MVRHRYAQLAALPASDRRVLLQALALLPAMTVGRHVLSYRRLQSLLTTLLPPRLDPSVIEAETRPHAERIARMVQIAARRSVLRPNCLDRSLVLSALLHRNGIEAVLRIGARKDGERFEAHAWVTVDDVVLNDAETVGQQFVAF